VHHQNHLDELCFHVPSAPFKIWPGVRFSGGTRSPRGHRAALSVPPRSRLRKGEEYCGPKGQSRGRLIPFGRWPGVSAGTRRPERTALAGSTYGDGFPRSHR
jgi:hypothetical protein